ncbi:hypothetical protein CS542_10050 [Pedobacter sp. IW39]|nr:hypothetical protein CS542_10050 [Pedobacter sp. IW39]
MRRLHLSRTAYELDLKGPAVSVFCLLYFAACVTSSESLRKQCDVAIAGGQVLLRPFTADIFTRKAPCCRPRWTCRSFDADATGTVFVTGPGSAFKNTGCCFTRRRYYLRTH